MTGSEPAMEMTRKRKQSRKTAVIAVLSGFVNLLILPMAGLGGLGGHDLELVALVIVPFSSFMIAFGALVTIRLSSQVISVFSTILLVTSIFLLFIRDRIASAGIIGIAVAFIVYIILYHFSKRPLLLPSRSWHQCRRRTVTRVAMTCSDVIAAWLRNNKQVIDDEP